jgi:hypothetical protein
MAINVSFRAVALRILPVLALLGCSVDLRGIGAWSGSDGSEASEAGLGNRQSGGSASGGVGGLGGVKSADGSVGTGGVGGHGGVVGTGGGLGGGSTVGTGGIFGTGGVLHVGGAGGTVGSTGGALGTGGSAGSGGDLGADARPETGGPDNSNLLVEAGEKADTASDSGPGATRDVADVAEDLVLASDVTADSAGRNNGSSCSRAEQCRSGFCIGDPGHCCSQSCSSVCYQANRCTTGSCVPANGTITCGDQDALCGLVVNDPSNASQWSFQTNLQVGDQAVGSDPYTISVVPPELAHAPWIRPSRPSKMVTTNPLVTFSISAPADVYLGIDNRVDVPSWMSGWADSGLAVTYVVSSSGGPAGTVTQRLLKARFPAGEVALGPMACSDGANCSMYLTIIKFADQPSGTAIACK